MIGMSDDNERILELITERMAIGEERYGHGLRKNDDTKQWGTKTNSWTEMGLEEALDLTIYLSTQLIRIMDIEEKRIEHVLNMAKKIKELEQLVVALNDELNDFDTEITMPQDNDSDDEDFPRLWAY